MSSSRDTGSKVVYWHEELPPLDGESDTGERDRGHQRPRTRIYRAARRTLASLLCADAYDVNLVILGAHGYGPVEKHFVGTTTNKVMTKVSQPMLTVKI